MGALLFDRLTLRRNHIVLPDGERRTFRDLGLDDQDTLRLHAREVVLGAAPPRAMELVADHVVVADPDVVLTPPDAAGAHTRVVAQRIEGPLRIRGSGTGGRLSLWYVAASPAPVVDGDGRGVDVTRLPDSRELWTRWQEVVAHTVSDVTAVGADLV